MITDTHPRDAGAGIRRGPISIQFQPRTIDDILKLDDGRGDERAFEVVNRVSQINQGLYDTFLSPVVKALSNEGGRAHDARPNPARMERWAFSDLNPWMWWVKPRPSGCGRTASRSRPTTRSCRWRRKCRGRSRRRSTAIATRAMLRPSASSRRCTNRPGFPPRSASCPAAAASAARAPPTWEREELKRLKLDEIEAWVETGTLVDAWARLLLYLGREDKIADERPFNLLRKMLEETKPENIPSLAALKAALKRQAFVLALHEERAIAALPALAPDTQLRRRGYDAARKIMRARGELRRARSSACGASPRSWIWTSRRRSWKSA